MASSHSFDSDNPNGKDKKQGQTESQVKNTPKLLNLNVLLIGDVINKENFYNFIEEGVFEKRGQQRTDKAILTPGTSFYHAILSTSNCKFQLWLLGDKSLPPATPQIVINFPNTRKVLADSKDKMNQYQTELLEDCKDKMNQYQKAHFVILTNSEQTKKLVEEKKIDVRPVPKNQYEAVQTLTSIGDMLCKVCKQYNAPNEKILDKYHRKMYEVLTSIIGVRAVPIVAEYVELDCIEQKQRNPLLVNFFMEQNQKNKISFMVGQALELHDPLLLIEVYLHYKENKNEKRADSIFGALKNLISEMGIHIQPYVRKIREILNEDPRLQDLKLESSSAEAILPQSNLQSINTASDRGKGGTGSPGGCRIC